MQCVFDICDSPEILEPQNKTYLKFMLHNALRHGFSDIIFLGKMEARKPEFSHPDLSPVSLRILRPEDALACSGQLDEAFLYMSADTLPDFNWLNLAVSGKCLHGNVFAQCMGLHGEKAHAFWLERDLFLRHLQNGSKVADLVKSVSAKELEFQGTIYRQKDWAGSRLPARGAVFLDRDGVLNRDYGYVGSADRWEWLPGAVESVKAINDAGLYVFVVTNQSGIARGYFREEDARCLHDWAQAELAKHGAHIDAFRYCPYLSDAVVPEYRKESDWRKPGAGMLKDICAYWPVDLSRSILVGDSDRDIAAGAAFGLKTWKFQEDRLNLDAIYKALMAGA